LLKKKKREAELSAAKWSGMTPAPGIAYKEDCGECCVAYFCPCCLAKTYWRVTGQGVFYKREPPCGLWMEGKFLELSYFCINKFFFIHTALTLLPLISTLLPIKHNPLPA